MPPAPAPTRTYRTQPTTIEEAIPAYTNLTASTATALNGTAILTKVQLNSEATITPPVITTLVYIPPEFCTDKKYATIDVRNTSHSAYPIAPSAPSALSAPHHVRATQHRTTCSIRGSKKALAHPDRLTTEGCIRHVAPDPARGRHHRILSKHKLRLLSAHGQAHNFTLHEGPFFDRTPHISFGMPPGLFSIQRPTLQSTPGSTLLRKFVSAHHWGFRPVRFPAVRPTIHTNTGITSYPEV